MENVGIDIDLDLDTKKAKVKLDNFIKSAKDNDIKVNLDFKNIEGEAKKLKNILNDAFKLNGKSLKSLDDAEKKLRNINKLLNAQNKASSKNSGSEIGASVSKYLAIGKKIEALYSDLYKSEKNGTDAISARLEREIRLHEEKQSAIAKEISQNKKLSDSTKEMIRREEELARARTDTRDTRTDTSNQAREIRQQEAEVTRLTASYNKYKNSLDDIQNKMSAMQNTRGFLDADLVQRTNNLLEQTRNSLDANGIQSDFEQVNNTIRQLTNNMRDLGSGNTLNRQEANFNTSLVNMQQRVERFANSFRDVNGANVIIDRLRASLSGIDTSNIERATVDLRAFGNELNRAGNEARQLDSGSRNGFFSNFGDEFRSNMVSFTAGELLADGIRSAVRALVSVTMEYDKAMTNLKKVANPEDIMNIKQIESIGEKANKIAQNVGKSSSETIQAIADTIQSTGLGMKQSIMVAEQTMKLSNVADMTQEAASKGVNTMLSAFNLNPMKQVSTVIDGVTKSTDELTQAIDVVNHVGNNFAVSSEGIITAIQSGGNVLATYGVSLNDTVSMIAAANTSLQNPEKVGNGLKSIAVNLAGIKASAKDGRSNKLPTLRN